MPAKPFQANTRHQSDAAIIDLRGEINAAAEAGLSAAYTEAEGRNPPSYDKQFLRDWLEQAQVAGRAWPKTPPAPALPAEVIARTAAKYREAMQRLVA